MKISKKQILTQKEMIENFYAFIKEEGQAFKKVAKVYARPAVPGERVETIVQSGLETVATATENQTLILAQTEAQERYLVKNDKFKLRYKPIYESLPRDLSDQGFLCYQGIGMVMAVKAKTLMDSDTEEAFFVASWGEKMRCQADDYIAFPVGSPKEIYRIAKAEFDQTYR